MEDPPVSRLVADVAEAERTRPADRLDDDALQLVAVGDHAGAALGPVALPAAAT